MEYFNHIAVGINSSSSASVNCSIVCGAIDTITVIHCRCIRNRRKHVCNVRISCTTIVSVVVIIVTVIVIVITNHGNINFLALSLVSLILGVVFKIVEALILVAVVFALTFVLTWVWAWILALALTLVLALTLTLTLLLLVAEASLLESVLVLFSNRSRVCCCCCSTQGTTLEGAIDGWFIHKDCKFLLFVNL